MIKRLLYWGMIAFLAIFSNNKLNAQTPGENFDVTHYEISLWNFDFTAHTLQGRAKVRLTATEPTNTFVLELKSLTVTNIETSFLLSGSIFFVENSFNQENDLLIITTELTLETGASADFLIDYGGNTFNESWGGIMWSGNATNGYYVCNMGVGFESVPHNLGKCWFPCVDNFADKATYDVFVTVSTELTAVCGGIFVGTTDNGNGTKTVHYTVPQEIATYHISFVVGDYVEWTDTYNGMEADIPINVYVKPSQINKVEGTFVHVKDIAQFFEDCLGPYPFNRIGYSITSVGCMEHIDNIGITSGVLTGNTTEEEYVAHELSHMWFGNKVTCATAEEMWLNEGFAQFWGIFYRSGVYGEDVFQEKITALTESITKKIKTANWNPLNNTPQTMTYNSDAVYNRGAVVVNTLMNYLGRETFLTGMRSYLSTHSYSTASSEQLRDALTASTGIDMNGFFDTYVFTPGMPHFGADLLEVTPNGSQYDATVKMTYQHRGASHVGQNNRVEVTFIDPQGQMQTAQVNWDGEESYQTVTLDINPIAAFVDYDNHILDAKIEKNMTATGNTAFTIDYLKTTVSDVTDSVMLRVESHLIGPDNDPGMPGLTLSTKHYWNVMRLDLGEATVNGAFSFSNSANMDGDIIHSQNDSAVLVYRSNILDTWHTIPYTQAGNWKAGTFTINDLQSGQYSIAVIDKTLELTEQNTSQNMFPNPASDQVTLQWNGNHNGGVVKIFNQNLQLVKVLPFNNAKQMTISVEDLASGLYFVEYNQVIQKLIVK